MAHPKTAVADTTPYYPGKGLGLPKAGPGSAASMGRRIAALIVDWVLCYLIVSGITRHSVVNGTSDPAYFATMWWTLLVFAVEVYLLTAISGLTVGKRLLGLRAIRASNGRAPGFAWALVRTLLLLTVIPPLMSDRDLRGLHDRAADTVVVRL